MASASSLVRFSSGLILMLGLASCCLFTPSVSGGISSSVRTMPPDFPRYAVTAFAVSTDVIDQESKLLDQVGAYNVTFVYRELDNIALVHEKLKAYGASMIPELSFMQTHEPTSRAGDVDR
jgi:hypothetical protein